MASFGTTGLTTGTGAVGTSGYQAPEIILGASRPTPQSDVYAMAGVILEVCTDSDAYRLAGLSDVYHRWSDNEWKAAVSSAAVSWSRLCGSHRWEEMPALRSPQFP